MARKPTTVLIQKNQGGVTWQDMGPSFDSTNRALRWLKTQNEEGDFRAVRVVAEVEIATETKTVSKMVDKSLRLTEA